MISIPRSFSILRCSFRSGRLFDRFPKSSNMARTSTPSFAFSASSVNSSLAIESLRKLKYSKWMLFWAFRMSRNRCVNLVRPLVSRVILLYRVTGMSRLSRKRTNKESDGRYTPEESARGIHSLAASVCPRKAPDKKRTDKKRNVCKSSLIFMSSLFPKSGQKYRIFPKRQCFRKY